VEEKNLEKNRLKTGAATLFRAAPLPSITYSENENWSIARDSDPVFSSCFGLRQLGNTLLCALEASHSQSHLELWLGPWATFLERMKLMVEGEPGSVKNAAWEVPERVQVDKRAPCPVNCV